MLFIIIIFTNSKVKISTHRWQNTSRTHW